VEESGRLLTETCGSRYNGNALILRSRSRFAGDDLTITYTDEVGESSSNIDPEANFRCHECHVPSPQVTSEVPMPVTVSSTPNPDAAKFTVGVPVGGPTTFVPSQPTDDPLGGALLALPGVASVFMTADFVTLNKLPDAAWDSIIDPAKEILEKHFSE
jgi:hypothetical protein